MNPVQLPTTIEHLPTPAAVVDLDVLERNIARMQAKASALGVALRPHVKTHKCVEIARLQTAAGARGLTVSTLEEARALVEHGFSDLVWAFPVILNRLAEVAELSTRSSLAVVVDSLQAVSALSEHPLSLPVWIKVDCGYGRAGVDPESDHALELARRITALPGLDFAGILTHSGQAYDGQLEASAVEEHRVMVRLASRLREAGIEVRGVSVGSTPAMSKVENLDGITEARPGNYVFHDWMQVRLGAAEIEDCALTVLASVVSCQPDAEHAVVDAGALSLSKDGPLESSDGSPCWGVTVEVQTGRSLDGLHLTSLSQEHGKLNRPLPVGTRIRILPIHSCLAAASFDALWVVKGARVVDRWRVWRGR